MERSNRMWSTGEGNGKPLQYSCLENPMNSMKMQNDRILKEKLLLLPSPKPSSPSWVWILVLILASENVFLAVHSCYDSVYDVAILCAGKIDRLSFHYISVLSDPLL